MDGSTVRMQSITKIVMRKAMTMRETIQATAMNTVNPSIMNIWNMRNRINCYSLWRQNYIAQKIVLTNARRMRNFLDSIISISIINISICYSNAHFSIDFVQEKIRCIIWITFYLTHCHHFIACLIIFMICIYPNHCK